MHEGVRIGLLAAYCSEVAYPHEGTVDQLGALAAEAAPALAAAREHEAVRELVRTDPLTGLLNRRGLDEALNREIARAARTGSPLSILMLDLDDFRAVNKVTYAHGDDVLREFARVLEDACRTTDILCRRGGEEFMLILAETPCYEALRLDSRIRALVSTTEFSHVGTLQYSSGITSLRPDDDIIEIDKRASAARQCRQGGGQERRPARLRRERVPATRPTRTLRPGRLTGRATGLGAIGADTVQASLVRVADLDARRARRFSRSPHRGGSRGSPRSARNDGHARSNDAGWLPSKGSRRRSNVSQVISRPAPSDPTPPPAPVRIATAAAGVGRPSHRPPGARSARRRTDRTSRAGAHDRRPPRPGGRCGRGARRPGRRCGVAGRRRGPGDGTGHAGVPRRRTGRRSRACRRQDARTRSRRWRGSRRCSGQAPPSRSPWWSWRRARMRSGS